MPLTEWLWFPHKLKRKMYFLYSQSLKRTHCNFPNLQNFNCTLRYSCSWLLIWPNIKKQNVIKVSHKINLWHLYSWVFIFKSNGNGSNLTTLLSPILSLSSTTTEPLITSWDELFYSLLTDIRVLHYHPSCHTHCHYMIILKFVVTEV